MAGKITALKYQKKNRQRVSVFLDGQFAFGLPAIVAASLKTGQILSEAEIVALQDQGAVESAYHRVLNYLSYRPRSKTEIRHYLQKRDVQDHQIEAVMERLVRAGLLDDEAFARYWVENRERFRPRGLRALRYELRNKGISERAIDRALASIDVADSAYRAGSKKARQLRQVDQQTFHQKMVGYLARRGFAYGIARETARRLWKEQADAG